MYLWLYCPLELPYVQIFRAVEGSLARCVHDAVILDTSVLVGTTSAGRGNAGVRTRLSILSGWSAFADGARLAGASEDSSPGHPAMQCRISTELVLFLRL
jgi:hypothetical protein